MAGGAALTAAHHVALCFKLFDDGGNSVHALFALSRKPLDREIPAVVFGEHQGKQPLGFQRKVRVAECRVGDNREVALMRGADDNSEYMLDLAANGRFAGLNIPFSINRLITYLG